jgi:pimeloyl-ACP methyl ester carboxylesterase
VQANGIELEYEVIGSGEPVVLIMGIHAQMIHWPDEFCRMLADEGFQVIRFDNRDSGLSTRLDDVGRPPVASLVARRLLGRRVVVPYTLSDLALDVVGLMEALKIDSAHVVGASMGGMIAQILAIEHPDRVRSLTSMLSSPGGRRYGFAKPSALRALLGQLPKTRDEAVTAAFAFAEACGSPAYPTNWPLIADIAGRAFDRGVCHDAAARQFVALVEAPCRIRELRKLRVPSLVIHGGSDPLVQPFAGRATAMAIPGATWRLIDGMGHDLPRGAWPSMVEWIRELAFGPASHLVNRPAHSSR